MIGFLRERWRSKRGAPWITNPGVLLHSVSYVTNGPPKVASSFQNDDKQETSETFPSIFFFLFLLALPCRIISGWIRMRLNRLQLFSP